CIDTSSASNAIFEINKLRKQLQGKDDTIRNLDAQINIMNSTAGSCDQQALETDRIQLKDTITSLRIQLDGLKVENVSLKRKYDELSKANTHSRTAYTDKLSALTAENAILKTELSGKKSSGSTASEKPKVLASGMYTNSSKYVPPPKRANWVKPTPLPKKKQVTFQEPPRTSNRPTQKPPVQQNKKPNVPVNLSTRTKPATESRKPMPKSHTRNHRILPSKSVNARRAADHNRKLNFVDHNQFVIRSLKSVNTKTPKAKHNMKTTKKVWKAKVVASVKPQWKPTGRHFTLYDICPLTRIMEPIVEPLELTPSVSSSSKVTMISRFTDCKLSDRKAGSKGISVKKDYVADSITERLTYDQCRLQFPRQIAVSFLSRNTYSVVSLRTSGLENGRTLGNLKLMIVTLMEEIDLFLASDDSMPPSIEDDDYDSEGDIRFLEELLNNDSFPLSENESSNLDHFNDPSPSRPPPEPPDVEICFDFEPDTGVVTNKVVGDISKHDVLMPNLLPTQPTLCPVFDLLLSFSSKNEDKMFNPGILISHLLSHEGEITSNFYKSPMMISGGDIPLLDVPYLHFYPP
ncbi:hypothetical protein Tco_1117242, partial [Tanacetum coccineum]